MDPRLLARLPEVRLPPALQEDCPREGLAAYFQHVLAQKRKSRQPRLWSDGESELLAWLVLKRAEQRRLLPSDLTDDDWNYIQQFF